MKTVVGIDIGEWVRVVAFTPQKGLTAHAKYELPRSEEDWANSAEDGLKRALEMLGDRLPPCEAVGVSVSPPGDLLDRIVTSTNTAHRALPFVSGAPVTFAGSEVAALFAHFSPAPKRAWIVFGNRARFYCEDAESKTALEAVDEQGRKRRIVHVACPQIMEPIRVLLDRLGLFGDLNEIESHAGIVEDSAGVRFAPRRAESGYDGIAVHGLKPGVRRPQIARAALESVAAWIRYTAAERAGEGAVTELYAAGRDASNEPLLSVIADVTGFTLFRTETWGAVATGAALRAAQAAGIPLPRPERRRFTPRLSSTARDRLYARWLEVSEP